eukprot:CAMPEP_0119407296 /NCGR_PEP_ID=MMETSP1335-20130426/1247_1 /TAXON_ID=259385 /ORGANISM="Chrysoculter rhomboideus, Strain RCC1486" /LENGTH=88 /DNA_ID=CAMNT_0007431393 /DNA_START=389 /DNA_END=656 /DNA_ORIENTATION=-
MGGGTWPVKKRVVPPLLAHAAAPLLLSRHGVQDGLLLRTARLARTQSVSRIDYLTTTSYSVTPSACSTLTAASPARPSDARELRRGCA